MTDTAAQKLVPMTAELTRESALAELERCRDRLTLLWDSMGRRDRVIWDALDCVDATAWRFKERLLREKEGMQCNLSKVG